MPRPQNSHHRQRFSPSQYQPEVHRVAKGRIVSTTLELVTPEMEEAAVTANGLISASGPRVRRDIKAAMVAASRDREWDVRDQLARETPAFSTSG